MSTYVDSSVLLRIVFGQKDRIRDWARTRGRTTSLLARLECLRTLDRARLHHGLGDDEVADTRAAIFRQLETFEIVDVDAELLERASQPFPVALKALDAIHLATALELRDEGRDLAFATHDAQLGRAARAMGFRVVGV